jgi:hypothetical protein
MAETVQTLVVKEASGKERIVPLDRNVITIGRDPSSTIRLDSQFVSRRHARIELQDSAPVLVDLGSRNGSLLNGTRVEGSVQLTAGDVIQIADVTIECLAEAAPDGTTRTFVPEKPAPPPPNDQLRVDAQAYEVWIGASQPEKRLSAQEFELLRYLYEHRDRVCTRQELGDAIWGPGNWDPNMLHRLVHRLKEKIEPTPDRPRYVQTVPWVGYRVTP